MQPGKINGYNNEMRLRKSAELAGELRNHDGDPENAILG
jgi:hypothetical protein